MLGAGQTLGGPVQAFFEPRFGRDFSHVRVHTDGDAAASAKAVNARAYTVGRDIVFSAGQYRPNTYAGRLLLAHELTHVIQQSGRMAALQRQPDAERAAAVAEAEAAVVCTTDQLEAQSDAEDALKLKWRRRRDKEYAWTLAHKDSTRIRKSGTLSAKHQQEITVKLRFFSGEAKAAYLRSITAAVSEFAEPAQLSEILAQPGCTNPKPRPSEPQTRDDIPCDLGQSEYLLVDEADPANRRCMDIRKDPEYQRLFDRNIVSADAYAVPGTTWENVDYDRFNVMVVHYANGKSEYFMLNEIGDFYYGRIGLKIRDHIYLKRRTDLIYPVFQDRIYFSELLTPRILELKNGLNYQVKQLQDLYQLLQAGGTFASILGFYGLGVESFKTSISAFRRGGPPRLPGRPLPGIGVKPSTPRVHVDHVFGELGGPRRGFKIQVVDDSTVVETPTSRSNIGLSTKYAGGAQTDPAAKQIWVHRSVVDANGVVRKWGATLDLKQVVAHELGHGINGGGSCAMASRTGADLPGLSAVQRTGLLDDAVHISRASSLTGERVSLQDLHLPTDYKPPTR
jgi:hypothetical protein